MVYISSKCAPGFSGPYSHEDCVTGPDPFSAGIPDDKTCQCCCHDVMRQQLAALRAQGFTPQQIRHIWLSGLRYRES